MTRTGPAAVATSLSEVAAVAGTSAPSHAASGKGQAMSRRTFLRRAGIGAGAMAAVAGLGGGWRVMIAGPTVRGGRAGPTFHEKGGRGERTNGAKRSIVIEILGLPLALWPRWRPWPTGSRWSASTRARRRQQRRSERRGRSEWLMLTRCQH
jgi:hypothetical protein